MALVIADRVKVRSYSTNYDDMLLETAVPGFQTFDAIGNGNTTFYAIEDHAGNWEVGLGTFYTDSTQDFLSRNTVYSSSNSNAKVNFPAGGKTISTTVPAAFLAQLITLTGYTP
jgi:hypothetical protein